MSRPGIFPVVLRNACRRTRKRSDCAYLAAALLVGLLGNALVGAWWLDPLVGLLTVAVEAWQGEGCCVASPLDGLDAASRGACADDACGR